MQVVKLGGSLLRDPLLPAWLERLATRDAGQTVIVPGGGPFADITVQAFGKTAQCIEKALHSFSSRGR